MLYHTPSCPSTRGLAHGQVDPTSLGRARTRSCRPATATPAACGAPSSSIPTAASTTRSRSWWALTDPAVDVVRAHAGAGDVDVDVATGERVARRGRRGPAVTFRLQSVRRVRCCPCPATSSTATTASAMRPVRRRPWSRSPSPGRTSCSPGSRTAPGRAGARRARDPGIVLHHDPAFAPNIAELFVMGGATARRQRVAVRRGEHRALTRSPRKRNGRRCRGRRRRCWSAST